MDTLELLHGLTPDELVRLTGISSASARRWLRLRRIPPPARRLLELVRTGELGQIHPAWQGWKVTTKNIFDPDGNEASQGEIRSIRARLAQLAELERERRTPSQADLFPQIEHRGREQRRE